MNRRTHILAILIAISSLSAFSQPLKQYSMVSLMDGFGQFVTDSNTLITLPTWGYDWTQPSPSVKVPGPTIYAKQGDSVHLEMINPSMEGHTIHLHGLDVDQANDGVPHTSDFIQEGDSFTYKFKATHAGNFLYHCHVTTTMHLALGMYGMVIVYPSDSGNRIYDNGPLYDIQHEYLFSDMDARWNMDYTAIGGFLTYDPDLYLINGKNKFLLYADSNIHVKGPVGQQHLMRFLNVGYRVNRVIFPPELNAAVHTSDGRPVPSFVTDTLVLYPGERYSVLAEIMDTSASYVSVDYLDPYRLQYLGREYIPVNNEDFEFIPYSEVDDLQDTIGLSTNQPQKIDVRVYPNPTKGRLNFESTTTIVEVYVSNLLGQRSEVVIVPGKNGAIDLEYAEPGIWWVELHDQNGMFTTEEVIILSAP